MNVYAKFRNFPLRINKALGIFRIGVTTTRRRRTRRTTRVAVRDAFQRLKIIDTWLNLLDLFENITAMALVCSNG